MQGKKFLVSLLILMVAATGHYLKYIYAYLIIGLQRYRAMDSDIRNVMVQGTTVALCLAATWVLSSFSLRRSMRLLGMDRPFFIAMSVALVCCLPMFIGGYTTSSFNADISLRKVFTSAVWAGLSEELVYRAFITGLLVRLARWHFVPAAFISAILFSYGHLYQATSFGEAVMVLAVTAGAGVGFALFYLMWNWNLWFIVGMHIFMNLSFVIFDAGSNVLLSPMGNIFRGITLVLAIVASVIYQRRYKRNQGPELPIITGARL